MRSRKEVNWLKTTDLVPGLVFRRSLRCVVRAAILAEVWELMRRREMREWGWLEWLPSGGVAE